MSEIDNYGMRSFLGEEVMKIIRRDTGPAASSKRCLVCMHRCLPVVVFVGVFFLIIMMAGFPRAEKKYLFLGFAMGKDSQTVPVGWEHLQYLGSGENAVSLVKEGTRTVLHMESLRSASGMLKRVNGTGEPRVNLEEYPVLVWSWKVNRTVGMAIETRKDRNDSAGRVRVIFGQGQRITEQAPEIEKLAKYFGVTIPQAEPSGFKIDYIWATWAEKDTILDYPGGRHHKMIVIERGNEKANRWVWEKRNLFEDFQTCFNADPPGLAGVVVLTDTDQTNEGVEAWYGSIVFMKDDHRMGTEQTGDSP